jgi:hypothetical protein
MIAQNMPPLPWWDRAVARRAKPRPAPDHITIQVDPPRSAPKIGKPAVRHGITAPSPRWWSGRRLDVGPLYVRAICAEAGEHRKALDNGPRFPGVRQTVVFAGRGAFSQVVAGDGFEPS